MKLSAVTAALGMMVLGSGCAPSASNNGGCQTQGLFTDQASCGSATGTTCTMTTLQFSPDSKSLVCWKAGLKPTPTPTKPKDILPVKDLDGLNLDVATPVVIADLFSYQHSSKDCLALKGNVVRVDPITRICSLAGKDCPSGWRAYYTGPVSWMATAETTDTQKTDCGMGSKTVRTAFHSNLAPLEVEKLTFCPSSCMGKCRVTDKTIYAQIVRRGCY